MCESNIDKYLSVFISPGVPQNIFKVIEGVVETRSYYILQAVQGMVVHIFNSRGKCISEFKLSRPLKIHSE